MTYILFMTEKDNKFPNSTSLSCVKATHLILSGWKDCIFTKVCLSYSTEDSTKQVTSSSRGNTKVLQLKWIEDIVLNLMEEEDAWPFVRPVNKKDVSES